MSNAKRLLAAALASVSLIAIPATSIVANGSVGTALACGNTGSSSCG
jgi:hypothetical protein